MTSPEMSIVRWQDAFGAVVGSGGFSTFGVPGGRNCETGQLAQTRIPACAGHSKRSVPFASAPRVRWNAQVLRPAMAARNAANSRDFSACSARSVGVAFFLSFGTDSWAAVDHLGALEVVRAAVVLVQYR